MDEFQKEVIANLMELKEGQARLETKVSLLPCSKNSNALDEQNRIIFKLRQKIDNKISSTKIWILIGLVCFLSNALGAVVFLWFEKRNY